MSKSRLNSKTDSEEKAHEIDFWSRHGEETLTGEFWADRIKKLRGEPAKRLELALKNFPLPASFREAAIATRAIIREKRKAKESYEEELALLYWLAAINSFYIPYSQVLQAPGYNVIESIPEERLKGLPFSYKELGYEKLTLLNKTDSKWLVELWGESNQHTTLHDIHIDIWHEYESKLKEKYVKLNSSISQHVPDVEKTLESTNNNAKVGVAKEQVIYGRRSKTETKGKAIYQNQAGRDFTIEELALQHYRSEGYNGYWSENDYWWQIMMLLYWDVVYAKLPGAFEESFGEFPSELQDIPRGMFTEEFYARRKKLFDDRHNSLGKSSLFGLRAPSSERELRKAWKKNKGKPCRIFDKWQQFTVDELAFATRTLNHSQLVKIMDRLIRDFNWNRSGLPDLFLAKDSEPLFVEVKSAHEKIANHQTRWHEYLIKVVGVPVVVCRVTE